MQLTFLSHLSSHCSFPCSESALRPRRALTGKASQLFNTWTMWKMMYLKRNFFEAAFSRGPRNRTNLAQAQHAIMTSRICP